MRTDKDLYRFHVLNSRKIKSSIKLIETQTREIICVGNKNDIKNMESTYLLLIAIWAESVFNKVLYEPNGFSPKDRLFITGNGQNISQVDKWEKLVEISFRKHYKIPHAALQSHNLPHSAFSRYETLNKIIENELKPIITLRNGLAHGQWLYIFNTKGDEIVTDQMRMRSKENFLSLKQKKNLLNHFFKIIIDLIVSKSTFNRDFDETYLIIEHTLLRIDRNSYSDYISKLQIKYKNGIEQKKSNYLEAYGK